METNTLLTGVKIYLKSNLALCTDVEDKLLHLARYRRARAPGDA